MNRVSNLSLGVFDPMLATISQPAGETACPFVRGFSSIADALVAWQHRKSLPMPCVSKLARIPNHSTWVGM